jgi:hypothetical protein
VVVGFNETRPVRRVVKELPVEMLQQRSSANSCMQMPIVMKEALHQISAFHGF